MTYLARAVRQPQRKLLSVLADQVFWSGAFFVFTLSIGLRAPSDFAPVAIATSFSLIVLAVTRAWTVDSVLLFGPGVGRSTRRTMTVFCGGGAIASTMYSAWSVAISGSTHWLATLLAFALVFGDNARYTWTTQGRSERSLPLSAAYFTMALMALLASRAGMPLEFLVIGWATLLCVLGAAGVRDRPESPQTIRDLQSVTRPRIALALEALYFMAASQVSLLALSVLGDAEDVSGLRLAYAVALAPGALIVQALGTQVLRYQGARRGTRRGQELGHYWGWLCALIYVLNAACALGTLSIWDTPSLSNTTPFILPICALLSAQAVSNAMHTVLRYHVRIATSQALRIGTLFLEVGLQIGGVAVGGVEGLILGMYAGAAMRLVLWISMSKWLRTRSEIQRE